MEQNKREESTKRSNNAEKNVSVTFLFRQAFIWQSWYVLRKHAVAQISPSVNQAVHTLNNTIIRHKF